MRNQASFPPRQFLGDGRGMFFFILMVIMMLAMVTITLITWENWQRLGGRFPRERGREAVLWRRRTRPELERGDLGPRIWSELLDHDDDDKLWLFGTARLRILKGLWHSWLWSFAEARYCAMYRTLWSSPPCSSRSSSSARGLTLVVWGTGSRWCVMYYGASDKDQSANSVN